MAIFLQNDPILAHYGWVFYKFCTCDGFFWQFNLEGARIVMCTSIAISQMSIPPRGEWEGVLRTTYLIFCPLTCKSVIIACCKRWSKDMIFYFLQMFFSPKCKVVHQCFLLQHHSSVNPNLIMKTWSFIANVQVINYIIATECVYVILHPFILKFGTPLSIHSDEGKNFEFRIYVNNYYCTTI